MNVEIVVPDEYIGDVMGDLNSRRGRHPGHGPQGQPPGDQGPGPAGRDAHLRTAPLTSMTGGRGSFHMEFSHYEEVPAHLQQKIVAEAKAERGDVKEEE